MKKVEKLSWKKLKQKIEYLLFPPYCVICGELLFMEHWGGYLCPLCEKEIPFLAEIEQDRYLSKVDKGNVVCETISAFEYEVISQSIHRFKFKNGKKDGEGLGDLMGIFLEKSPPHWLMTVDYIIPVPLHKIRQWQRGFNQSEVLCKSLSARIGIPYQKDKLHRIKNVKPQRTLSAKERKTNVKNIFIAEECGGETILLIDDVFTTGTTANECGKELYKKGAKEVYIFTLAMTK